MTQTEIAKKLAIPRSTYSNYELGNREPDFHTTEKLAQMFGVSIDYLLGRTDEEVKLKEEPPDANKIVAEKLLSYLHQGLTNDEIRARMDFVLDVFTLEEKHANEWLDFVREQLKKKQEQTLAAESKDR
jgi:transcriptional regulator with XRE-family HTH domain